MTYNAELIIAHGSFGVVYKAKVFETGETVAVKKIFYDPRYKCRELDIMKELNHTNCVKLRQGFFTKGDSDEEIFLNLAMDYVPETLKSVQLHYKERKELVPIFLSKLYMY